MPTSVHDLIASARVRLVEAGLDPADAALDAEVLAREILRWDRAGLLTHGQTPASDAFLLAFDDAVRRRSAHEPVAYIIGHREFWGLELEVTPDVLIPRPETELVVQAAVEQARAREPGSRIADVGTGSGCIAIALAVELPRARIVGIDRSGPALAVAARNVRRHAVAGRVRLVQGNLLDAIRGPLDLIVSNPPYVARADADTLQPEVKEFEPAAALFAGDDGLAVLEKLCAEAPARLAPGGTLIVEFGFGQERRLRGLAAGSGWIITTMADLAGIPRVAVMTRRGEA